MCIRDSSGAAGAREDVSGFDFWAGGGGGGAASAGAQPTQNGTANTTLTSNSTAVGGAGGAGRSLSWITQSIASTLGVGQASSSSVFFAGGGGGGMGADGQAGGPGGVGGGATGSRYEATANAGTPSTGGGGGGSGFDDISPARANNAPGGAGGSGVVIVRYQIPPNAPTISSVTSQSQALSVAFSAPTANGATISDYQYSINNGSNWTSAGLTSPFTISGLTNGTSYTVLLRAVNGTNASSQSTGVSSTPLAACSTTPDTSSSPGYTVLKYETVGTCRWTTPNGVSSVDVLVVGGGGGGSGNFSTRPAEAAGSGGAGGVYPATGVPVSSIIEITVGAGGQGGTSTSSRSGNSGLQGGTSRFGTISAGGGGGGGCESAGTGNSCASGTTIHGLTGTAAGNGGSPSNFLNAYSAGSAGSATSAIMGGTTFQPIAGFRGGWFLSLIHI